MEEAKWRKGAGSVPGKRSWHAAQRRERGREGKNRRVEGDWERETGQRDGARRGEK